MLHVDEFVPRAPGGHEEDDEMKKSLYRALISNSATDRAQGP